MPPGPVQPVLVTHHGRFHCDEVVAYAVLRLALGLHRSGEDHQLVRTRDMALIEGAAIVWDVGLVSDAAANRFDHHQRGAPLRADGTPYSSAGLVWQVYGERAVAAVLSPDRKDRTEGGRNHAAAIAGELDETMLRRIDELDNGVSPHGPVVDDVLGLGQLIGDFNPSWDSEAASGPADSDAAFLEAAALATGVLRRRVDAVRARLDAEALVLAAHAAGDDPRILVLDRGMPWKAAVFGHDLPVIYAVSPTASGNWMVDAAPSEAGSFAQRLPLPVEWAGLEGRELAASSGVADAVFVHVRRFVGAARSRAGAIDLARRALEGSAPANSDTASSHTASSGPPSSGPPSSGEGGAGP